ncbi:hypothetical protein OAI93_03515 [bacterium]|nr:hypothetical protein [bacterium]
MFKTEDIIGDIVFVSLVNEQGFKSIGITKSAHYLVKGIDHIGLWLQHPGITTKNEEITSYIKEGVFLVMWGQINTIMHYPNREGYDFPSEFDKEIGFLKDK